MRLSVLCTILLLPGCGPSAKERTLSLLNTEADQWPGGANFATNATDAYGNKLASNVEKGPLHYVLEIRSNGPDGLPKNSDDIIVTRRERHGESTLTEEAKKSVEAVSSGAARGAITGIKEGLGFGDKEKQ